MIGEYARDVAMNAVIFGFFTTTWLGWAQESPPRSWRRWLLAGVTAGALTAAAAGVVAAQTWSDGTVFDEETSRTFGIVVGIEFAAAAIGAVALAVTRRSPLIPVWIALVVGVHLFPVAVILKLPAIHVVAALITVASLAAVPIARSRSLTPSAVVGVGAGVPLLAGALYSLAVAAFAY